MSDDWRSLGMVAGIFWIGRYGLTLKFGPLGPTSVDGGWFTFHRFWPFVFVVARP